MPKEWGRDRPYSKNNKGYKTNIVNIILDRENRTKSIPLSLPPSFLPSLHSFLCFFPSHTVTSQPSSAIAGALFSPLLIHQHLFVLVHIFMHVPLCSNDSKLNVFWQENNPWSSHGNVLLSGGKEKKGIVTGKLVPMQTKNATNVQTREEKGVQAGSQGLNFVVDFIHHNY